jgi:hypothetical protein
MDTQSGGFSYIYSTNIDIYPALLRAGQLSAFYTRRPPDLLVKSWSLSGLYLDLSASSPTCRGSKSRRTATSGTLIPSSSSIASSLSPPRPCRGSTTLSQPCPAQELAFGTQLQQAWKALRHQYPQIAAVPDETGTKFVYTVPLSQELEAWLKETFIVVPEGEGSSADGLFTTLPPSLIFKLYYLPHSRELLFRTPHWRIDCGGMPQNLTCNSTSTREPAAPSAGGNTLPSTSPICGSTSPPHGTGPAGAVNIYHTGVYPVSST